MAKVLEHPGKGAGSPRKVVAVRGISRRLRKLAAILREMEAEIGHWQALLPAPSPDEVREIFEENRELPVHAHLLGVLYRIGLHLDEACSMAEEQARYDRCRSDFFYVHPQVERALRTIAAIRNRGSRVSNRQGLV